MTVTILKDTDTIKNVEMNKFFNLVISLIIYQRDKNILEVTRILRLKIKDN